jgi:RNA-directed DNA polymerase
MEESHVEGVAIHDGPRSCVVAREGAGEAFDRGTCGPGIEPRNAQIQGADAVIRGGRQHVRHRQREMSHGPARSETPCTHGTSLRENREICGLLGAVARRAASGRP